MPDIHFDRYYRYDDLTRLLHDYAIEFPHLVQVESIGQSYDCLLYTSPSPRD